ncbi:MAG: aromatic prenyltransferase [Candidatus Odinarchaeota archaeon]
MEWPQKIKKLFEDMVLRIPDMVKPIIKPMLFETSEKICKERNGRLINEMDLVVALFEVTPPAFQPTMIEDLKDLGVNIELYLPKVISDFKLKNNLEQMVKDIHILCDLTKIDFNENAVWKALNAYKKFYSGSSLSIRTTTKPIEKRDVSVRYVEMMIPHNPDPYSTALSEGLIEENSHPIHKMILETLNTFDIMGYGVDIDARKGLSKIWPFIIPGSINPLFSMKYIPGSIKNNENYFKRHGLTTLALFAFDFLHYSTNIYFMLKNPSTATSEKCNALVEDLGFEIASEEVMELCCNAAHLNYTFTWHSQKVERLCFGMVCQNAREVPIHLHPLIKDFVEKSPFQSDIHKFIYGVTFTPKGIYFKIENDYNGTMVDFLLMGAKAGIESYK